MKKFFVLFTLCLVGCVNTPGAATPTPYNYRDDVWCWHQDHNNEWHVQGLAESCPLGASYGWRHPGLRDSHRPD